MVDTRGVGLELEHEPEVCVVTQVTRRTSNRGAFVIFSCRQQGEYLGLVGRKGVVDWSWAVRKTFTQISASFARALRLGCADPSEEAAAAAERASEAPLASELSG
jgi:hypothetical protein